MNTQTYIFPKVTLSTATDSFRLIEIETPEFDIADYPNIEREIIKEIDTPILVEAKLVKTFKLASKTKLPILHNAVLVKDGKYTGVYTTDLDTQNEVGSIFQEDKFPNYENIIPTGDSDFSVRVNPKMLAELLDVMSGVDKDDVQIDFFNTRNVLVLRSGKKQKGRALMVYKNK